jgi:hypothetical protein
MYEKLNTEDISIDNKMVHPLFQPAVSHAADAARYNKC